MESFSTFAADVSLSNFIYWGWDWDVTLTMNEESKDLKKTPGSAATVTILVIKVLYKMMPLAALVSAGVREG